MRIRTIKPEFWSDERVGRLTHSARLLFIATLNLADDSGRFGGNRRQLEGLLFWSDEAPRVDLWMAELEREGMVRGYTVDGCQYWEVVNFNKHQKIDKRADSKLPSWEKRDLRQSPPIPPEKLAEPADSTPIPPEKLPRKGKEQGKDGNGKEQPRNEFADLLFSAFKEEMGSPYKHSREDFIGLAAILKSETKDEVMLRWRRGLRKKKDTGYGPSTIAQLASGKFWNDLAIERKPFGSKQAQPEPEYFQGTGEITAEDIPF